VGGIVGLKDELKECMVNVADLGSIQGWRWGGIGPSQERALIYPTSETRETFEGRYWKEGDLKPMLVVRSTFEKVVALIEDAAFEFGQAPSALERLAGEEAWLDA
jgi:hypothetical protein